MDSKKITIEGGNLIKVSVQKQIRPVNEAKILEARAASKLVDVSIEVLVNEMADLRKQLKRTNYLLAVREKERDQVKLAHKQKLHQIADLKHRLDMAKQDVEIANDRLSEVLGEEHVEGEDSSSEAGETEVKVLHQEEMGLPKVRRSFAAAPRPKP